jgi:hypothetical protein
MKYYTLAWWLDCQTPSTFRDPLAEYRSYLDTIRHRLPPDLLVLEDEASMHDGELDLLQLDTELRTLLLRIQGDDGKGKPRTFLLKYEGVTSFESRTSGREALPGPAGYGDLGYYEVDVRGSQFEHSFLFSTGIELTVVFDAFRLQMTDHEHAVGDQLG